MVGAGTHTQARILGHSLNSSPSFLAPIQLNSKSCRLYLENTPTIQPLPPTSTTTTCFKPPSSFAWIIIEASQLEVSLPPFFHTHSRESSHHSQSEPAEAHRPFPSSAQQP